MPEGAEVRYFSEKLSKMVAGYVLLNIVIHRGPYKGSKSPRYLPFRKNVEEFAPHIVEGVRCKGKWMYFVLRGREQFYALGIHHGMEGSWCSDPTNKHIILELIFEYDQHYYFQDSRRFGTFCLLRTRTELDEKLNKLAPDMFYITKKEFKDNFSQIKNNSRIRNKRLCELLMEQSLLVSGIGNYMRADILYHAKLDPRREISNLKNDEINALYKSIKHISKESYRCKATTCGNYESAIHRGLYEPLVYRKEVCPNSCQVVSFVDKKKRTMWWVPEIQK